MSSNANDAMAAQVQQIAEIKARCNRLVNTSIRGVQGGFVVQGTAQYQDKDTRATLLADNIEGVAATAQLAAQMSLNYHVNGDFGLTDPLAPASAQPAAI